MKKPQRPLIFLGIVLTVLHQLIYVACFVMGFSMSERGANGLMFQVVKGVSIVLLLPLELLRLLGMSNTYQQLPHGTQELCLLINSCLYGFGMAFLILKATRAIRNRRQHGAKE